VHDCVAAAWVTVITRSATVRDPVRSAPVLGPTEKVTDPLPPAPADVTVIHGALLTAVHGQPVPVRTETDRPLAPPAGTVEPSPSTS